MLSVVAFYKESWEVITNNNRKDPRGDYVIHISEEKVNARARGVVVSGWSFYKLSEFEVAFESFK